MIYLLIQAQSTKKTLLKVRYFISSDRFVFSPVVHHPAAFPCVLPDPALWAKRSLLFQRFGLTLLLSPSTTINRLVVAQVRAWLHHLYPVLGGEGAVEGRVTEEEEEEECEQMLRWSSRSVWQWMGLGVCVEVAEAETLTAAGSLR